MVWIKNINVVFFLFMMNWICLSALGNFGIREILRCSEILGAVERPTSNRQKGGTYYEKLKMWTRTYYYVGQEPLMKIMVGTFQYFSYPFAQ